MDGDRLRDVGRGVAVAHGQRERVDEVVSGRSRRHARRSAARRPSRKAASRVPSGLSATMAAPSSSKAKRRTSCAVPNAFAASSVSPTVETGGSENTVDGIVE